MIMKVINPKLFIITMRYLLFIAFPMHFVIIKDNFAICSYIKLTIDSFKLFKISFKKKRDFEGVS